MDNERRHDSRLGAVDLLDYLVITPDGEKGDYSMGRTLNISEGGVLMEIPKKLPLETHVMITLDLGEELIELKGRVVHVAYSAKRYQVGVKFFEVAEETLRRLHKFIAAFQKQFPEPGHKLPF